VESLDSWPALRAYTKTNPCRLSQPTGVHVLRILEVALLVTLPLVFSAVGYSILYLLLGGGVGGAVLIFLIAKMLRR